MKGGTIFGEIFVDTVLDVKQNGLIVVIEGDGFLLFITVFNNG